MIKVSLKKDKVRKELELARSNLRELKRKLDRSERRQYCFIAVHNDSEPHRNNSFASVTC